MDLSFITEMYVPIILVSCLVVGYIVKKWIADVDNKYIPTIVTILGAVLGALVNGPNIDAIVGGAVTGLASTGMHQLFKQLIEGTNDIPKID